MIYIIYVILFFVIISNVNYFVCKRIGLNITEYKYKTLNGLRGICASFVVISHLFWRWGEGNYSWGLETIESSFFLPIAEQMAGLSVGFFFILSGFLFFKYAVNPNKSILFFLKNRAMRIYPSVLFAIFLIFLAIIMCGNAYLLSTCGKSFLDLIPTPFGPFDNTLICGYNIFLINSGVLWTLVWEIRLYLFIPILYTLFKYTHRYITVNIVFTVLLFLLYFLDILNHNQSAFIGLFLCGFIAASLEKKINLPNYYFWIGILSFMVLYSFMDKYYSPFYVFSMFFIFYPLMKGYNPLNIFNNEKIQYLGLTSFSIYLNHGVFQFISKQYLYQEGFLIWQIFSILLIAFFAPFMYKYIENKFK